MLERVIHKKIESGREMDCEISRGTLRAPVHVANMRHLVED